MREDAEKSGRWLQLIAIPLAFLILSMILHKASTDIALLLQNHSGREFWIALANYFLRNLSGG